MKTHKLTLFLPRIIVAFILLQTLFFKFGISGQEALQESQEIFGTIALAVLGSADHEAIIRIGTGILELAASILILLNATVYIGAFLSASLMAGAMLSHLLFIGIEVRGDNGQLFIMALIVFISSIKVLFDNWPKIMNLIAKK